MHHVTLPLTEEDAAAAGREIEQDIITELVKRHSVWIALGAKR